MIYTHHLPLEDKKWTPLESTVGRPVFWQFLPPIIATWVRVDGQPAVQVRDYTRIRGTRLELHTLCKFYHVISPYASWAMTVVEFEGDDELSVGYDAKETYYDSVYSHVLQMPGCPIADNLIYEGAGWILELEVAVYGGNNDGAPAIRVELDSLVTGASKEMFFVASPGIRHIRRPTISVCVFDFDWTGGANLATFDCYVWERKTNVGIT